MSTTVSSVANHNKHHSVYAPISRLEATSLYNNLQNTLTRVTHAKYDALKSQSAQNVNATGSYHTRPFEGHNVDIDPDSLKVTPNSTAYNPVFQHALPVISTTLPSLITEEYEYSPSPMSASDWDGHSAIFGSGEDSTDGTCSTSYSIHTQALPTPCPSSPILGPSAPSTPFSSQQSVGGIARKCLTKFTVLPENLKDETALDSVQYLMESLTQLESSKGIGREGCKMIGSGIKIEQENGSEDEISSKDLIEKIWNRQELPLTLGGSMTLPVPSASHPAFSFNPTFRSSSSSPAIKPASPSIPSNCRPYDQPSVRGLFRTAIWNNSGLPPMIPPTRVPNQPQPRSSKSHPLIPSSHSKLNPLTPAFIPPNRPLKVTTTFKDFDPLAHNPHAFMWHNCSCSGCHWMLLKMSGVKKADIESVDDAYGTLRAVAIRVGAISPPPPPKEENKESKEGTQGEKRRTGSPDEDGKSQ
ncbi:hypothetical protein K435DRAFT_772883 [Dendrothele bispora CBS 962.96]|uniref:Uncharacterized protein n=1 Tax=Dendrothele bispora (strain CBS 962.96) TaxID=1314807 RepID=A0A4S8MV45_DENBC|nr:hypothetical protein K435DRAFT_772883 [Dendrothele bispora CBS 962.96]